MYVQEMPRRKLKVFVINVLVTVQEVKEIV